MLWEGWAHWITYMQSVAVVVCTLLRWCFPENQGTLCPVFSHYIQVRKAQKYCMSETFPAASLDLLPKLIEILLTEHSTSLWYLTLQNSFEGLGWIMKETRASGVHYLPHFMRRFYKVCCLPFQIHDRNKYKAWKERASQSCLLPSPLPPSPFLPVSQDTFVSWQLNTVLFLPKTLVLSLSQIVYSRQQLCAWEDVSGTFGCSWRRPKWSCSEALYLFLVRLTQAWRLELRLWPR